MHSVKKKGTSSSFPCHNCLLKAASFDLKGAAKRRNVEESCTLLKEASPRSLLSQDTNAKFLTLFIFRVLHRFSMEDVHVFVNNYAIFKFALVHRLALRPSKLFKTYVVRYLSEWQYSSIGHVKQNIFNVQNELCLAS